MSYTREIKKGDTSGNNKRQYDEKIRTPTTHDEEKGKEMNEE